MTINKIKDIKEIEKILKDYALSGFVGQNIPFNKMVAQILAINKRALKEAEKKGIEDNEIDFTKRLEVAVKEAQKKTREEMDLINGDKIENTWGQGIKTGREQVKKELKHKIEIWLK